MLKCLLSFRLKQVWRYAFNVFSRSTLLIVGILVISFIWNIVQVLTQYHELYIASGGQERLIIGETFPDLEKRLLECNAF